MPELTRVLVTRAARTMEGDDVIAGTEGTIVGIWNNGEAYDVEFSEALGPAVIEAKFLRTLA
ncbi:hypothetical protein HJG44_22120 [Enterovirga sp. DB1703]|uniref:DUF4926 domain-containing protein n=1 Tax=Enterovirga aerilata TaxID=2730920 RepID=A0A849ICR8_9HYPH|nr:hypothetical protein [Enterovirga sp. DB1703]